MGLKYLINTMKKKSYLQNISQYIYTLPFSQAMRALSLTIFINDYSSMMQKS